VSVTPTVTPAVNVSASSSAICKGGAVTFTANAVNGGTTPVFAWFKNGIQVGTDSTGYTTDAINNGDVFICVLTSNAQCATKTIDTSNTPIVNVKPLPVKPTITRSSDTLTASSIGTSYQWFKDGTAISGATARKYRFTQNGNYVVSVDSNGCPNISAAFVVSNVGMDNLSNIGSLSIYPNPASTSIIINAVFNSAESTRLQVLDMFGKIVYDAAKGEADRISSESIALDEFADGIYFIRILHGNAVATKKIVKTTK
jgi:hypothetical protein